MAWKYQRKKNDNMQFIYFIDTSIPFALIAAVLW